MIRTEEGKNHIQRVIYDWKPIRCSVCSYFEHGDTQCSRQIKPKQVWRVKQKANIEGQNTSEDRIHMETTIDETTNTAIVNKEISVQQPTNNRFNILTSLDDENKTTEVEKCDGK